MKIKQFKNIRNSDVNNTHINQDLILYFIEGDLLALYEYSSNNYFINKQLFNKKYGSIFRELVKGIDILKEILPQSYETDSWIGCSQNELDVIIDKY